jgi:hypothetical protein
MSDVTTWLNACRVGDLAAVKRLIKGLDDVYVYKGFVEAAGSPTGTEVMPYLLDFIPNQHIHRAIIMAIERDIPKHVRYLLPLVQEHTDIFQAMRRSSHAMEYAQLVRTFKDPDLVKGFMGQDIGNKDLDIQAIQFYLAAGVTDFSYALMKAGGTGNIHTALYLINHAGGKAVNAYLGACRSNRVDMVNFFAPMLRVEEFYHGLREASRLGYVDVIRYVVRHVPIPVEELNTSLALCRSVDAQLILADAGATELDAMIRMIGYNDRVDVLQRIDHRLNAHQRLRLTEAVMNSGDASIHCVEYLLPSISQDDLPDILRGLTRRNMDESVTLILQSGRLVGVDLRPFFEEAITRSIHMVQVYLQYAPTIRQDTAFLNEMLGQLVANGPTRQDVNIIVSICRANQQVNVELFARRLPMKELLQVYYAMPQQRQRMRELNPDLDLYIRQLQPRGVDPSVLGHIFSFT